MNRVHLGEQIQEGMLGHFRDVLGGACVHLQVGSGVEAMQRLSRYRPGLALGPGVAVASGDVKPRRKAGTDGGVKAGTGPCRVFQLSQQFIGCRITVAAVGVDETGAAPLRARQNRRHRLGP